MRKNKTLRAGISVVLAFFLAVSLFVLFAGSLIRGSYLPGNAWKSYLLGSGYGNKIAQAASEEMQTVLLNRGIAEEQVQKLVTEELLYTEYGYCVDDILQNREQEVARKTAFIETMKDGLMKYLSGNQAVLTENMEVEIDGLMKEISGIYDSYLNPSWLIRMADFSEKISGNLTLVLAIVSIFGILCIVLLWLMYHYKHRAVRYVCHGVVASIICNIAFMLFVNQMNWVEEAGIGPQSYVELVEGICRNGTKYGVLFIGIEALVVVVMAIWMKHLKHNVR